MNLIKSKWFSEVSKLCPGISQSLKVRSKLYEGKSDHHDILVFDTERYGKVLILDGYIQVCEFDEFAYPEMISYIPLCSHPEPRKVLIVGGGDGGVAKQVCKYPELTEVVQVERDKKLIEVCKEYLPSVAEGLSHPKLKLYVEDELKFIEKHKSEFDIIIIDLLDPIETPNKIFEATNYLLMKRALRKEGIICSQVGSPWTNLAFIVKTFKMCEMFFPSTSLALVSLPTYTTGQIGFILSSTVGEKQLKWAFKSLLKKDRAKLKLRYYTEEAHASSFSLPYFVQEAIGAADLEELTAWKGLLTLPYALRF